jgi:3-isopropylmalate dehydratase small subunit
MTSKTLYAYGMKIYSKFADIYLNFIIRNDIPSALRRDNENSEMIQRVEDIHTALSIDYQWTELHSPWQNPAELNVIQYLKNHMVKL